MITSAKAKRVSLPLWGLPTALSLDAPLVAVSWQWLFAKQFAVELGWLEPSLLFLTVWLIYAADRLLDGFKLDLKKTHTFRHAFYVNHRSFISLIWLLVFTLTASLTLFYLKPPLLYMGFITLALCGLYGLGVHRFKVFMRNTKELQIGLIFALGSSLIVWTQGFNLSLFTATLAFAALCVFNCLLIAVWEKRIDAEQSAVSLAQRVPKLRSYLQLSLGIFTLMSFLFAISLGSPFYAAITLASLGLLLFLKQQTRFSTDLLRVLADAVLLSPVLISLF